MSLQLHVSLILWTFTTRNVVNKNRLYPFSLLSNTSGKKRAVFIRSKNYSLVVVHIFQVLIQVSLSQVKGWTDFYFAWYSPFSGLETDEKHSLHQSSPFKFLSSSDLTVWTRLDDDVTTRTRPSLKKTTGRPCREFMAPTRKHIVMMSSRDVTPGWHSLCRNFCSWHTCIGHVILGFYYFRM
jgi:hypothetical protein